MAERQALGDPIGIGMMHFFAGAEITATSGAFALQKMAFTGAHAHDFTASGDFEPFRYRFFGLNAFWASHKNISFRPKWGCQKSGEYRVLVADLQVLLCKGRLSAFNIVILPVTASQRIQPWCCVHSSARFDTNVY